MRVNDNFLIKIRTFQKKFKEEKGISLSDPEISNIFEKILDDGLFENAILQKRTRNGTKKREKEFGFSFPF
jgi:hypothetical protein